MCWVSFSRETIWKNKENNNFIITSSRHILALSVRGKLLRDSGRRFISSRFFRDEFMVMSTALPGSGEYLEEIDNVDKKLENCHESVSFMFEDRM